MSPPQVSCLMPTYGRYTLACQSLACFLCQDTADCELVVLNNHEVPLVYDHPRVRILNRPQETSLGSLCQQLADEACGLFCRSWADDDLFLPWCVSQGLEHIGTHEAWKPARSWLTHDGHRTYRLMMGRMEGSILFRSDDQSEIGFFHGNDNEHRWLLEQVQIASTDMEWWSSYCFVWGDGGQHASDSMGESDLGERIRRWRAANQDVRPGEPLVPDYAGLEKRFRHMAWFVPEELREKWLTQALATFPEPS